MADNTQSQTKTPARAVPPAARRRLIEALEKAHRVATAAVADTREATSGVLAALKDGRGRE